MPVVENRIGENLNRLVADVIAGIMSELGLSSPNPSQAKRIFKSAFTLLAAKLLHDKGVDRFIRIALTNVPEVFNRVSRHYAEQYTQAPLRNPWKRALENAAERIASFSNLGNVSTEALAHLYENTFVSPTLRKELGIHSTPSYLIDYMLWQLAPWIEKIPVEERFVFEPACGHGAFLVGAMRMLRLFLGDVDNTTRRKYLREHLYGIEYDDFAREIAKLSLTLADIPNPNGWRLDAGDMYATDMLKKRAKRARILLSNPPYEQFDAKSRRTYERKGFPVRHSKAVEVLVRTLPHLPAKAVFGVVLPQGFLHSKEAIDVRKHLLKNFELSEICLFPDKVFQFSDMETTILLGRKRPQRRKAAYRVRYRRVREAGLGAFRESYQVNSDRAFESSRFEATPNHSLQIPELDDVWRYCSTFAVLQDFAHVQKGLEYKGKENLPAGSITTSKKRRRGLLSGFAVSKGEWGIYELPQEAWMNLDAAVIGQKRAGTTTGVPQVLTNYGRATRGPWRIRAALDKKGHPVTTRFLTVRPQNSEIPLEFFWALLNSPIANAYSYCHSLRRDNLTSTMRLLPIPSAKHRDIGEVVKAAKEYLALTEKLRAFMQPGPNEHQIREAILRMDAEILKLYDLPPRLERELLDLFQGADRKWVGCEFRGYYPQDFTPCIPLHEYLSEEYHRSTAGELRRGFAPSRSGAVIKALQAAVEAFGED